MTIASTGGTVTLGLYDTQSQLKTKADITYVDNKVDPLQAGHKGYATLAQAQAAQSGLAANTVVEVLSDITEANNGYYLWNGTTLTKTTFSPLLQANNYTDSKVATAKAEAIATSATDATTKSNAAISTASSDATTKANNAVTTANNYTDSRYNSLVVETEQFANQAEAAATAANIAGKVYATAAEGVAPITGVPSGQYFNVRSSSNDNYIDEYLNNAGVAQSTGKSYPSSAYVQDIESYVAKPFVSGKTYALNKRVQLATGDIVRSTIASNVNNPNENMTGWVNLSEHNILKNRDMAGAHPASAIADASGKTQQQINDASNNVYTKLFGLTSSELLDQTEIVQTAANVAKLMRKNLVINTLVSPAIVRLQEVDITGINVHVQEDILIKGVTKGVTSLDSIFKAIGSQESYAEKSSLTGANYDAEDASRNLFTAQYVKQPELSNVKTANLDILVSRTGFFQFCDKPKAVDCQTNGGITGINFYNCKEPKAIRVTADYCGRDGISFYTGSGAGGSLTSDALAQDCKVTRFAVVSDPGRGGVHFYGVRKGTALNCTVEDDSFSVHGTGNPGIRFRDCEDFYTDSYDVKDCNIGVLVNEIGDYSSQYGLITKGNIGSGSVSSIRSIGVGVVATRPVDCNIIGAKVDGVSGSGSQNAGIYHNGVGSIVGCMVKNIPNTSGLTANGAINVTGNTSINCGNGSLSVPHFRLSNGASASGNTFKDDRNTPVSTLAIRASAGKVTIGQNNYSDGISTTLNMNTGSTLSRDSTTYRSGYAEINLGGDIENGCTAINNQNVQFIYNNGWKRVSLKKITTTIGTSQTAVPHGLGYIPSVVTLLPKGNFNVWQSADADETNIYLTASTALSQVEVGCQ